MLTKINHIGIAVRSFDDAISLYRDTLTLDFMGVEEVEEYLVRVAFFRIGESKIELLEPASKASFLWDFLQRNGPGIHHIAYEVTDIEAAIAHLEAAGARMIDRKPRPGAHGARVAFVEQASCGGVLTELCQPGNVGEGH